MVKKNSKELFYSYHNKEWTKTQYNNIHVVIKYNFHSLLDELQNFESITVRELRHFINICASISLNLKQNHTWVVYWYYK